MADVAIAGSFREEKVKQEKKWVLGEGLVDVSRR